MAVKNFMTFFLILILTLMLVACGSNGEGSDILDAASDFEISEEMMESNPFLIDDEELHACMLEALGEEGYQEMQTRPPSALEVAKVTPCMIEYKMSEAFSEGESDGGLDGGSEGDLGSDSDGDLGEDSTVVGSSSSFGCEAATAGSYERFDSEFFLGIKVFTLLPGLVSVESADEIKEMGMNAVSLVFAIPYDDEGNIEYPFYAMGTPYNDVDDGLCKLGNLVHEMKEAGLTVYLSGEPQSANLMPGQEPGSLSKEAVDNYLSQLPEVMEKMAVMAETYKIEMLAPISEADKYFGAEKASNFMQEIVPLFEEYNGKLVWQIYDDNYRLDLKDYDIAGLAMLGCEAYRAEWDDYIDTIVGWANEDGVSEIAHMEMGCVQTPNSVDVALENLNHWLDITDQATGVIILDNPLVMPNAQSVKGTWVEEWAKSIAEEKGLN